MSTRRKWLSEGEARKAWRYAVEKEFHSINPGNTTEKQILGHGSEERFLPFDHSVEIAWFAYSINANYLEEGGRGDWGHRCGRDTVLAPLVRRSSMGFTTSDRINRAQAPYVYSWAICHVC